jgi:hypothetical protein
MERQAIKTARICSIDHSCSTFSQQQSLHEQLAKMQSRPVDVNPSARMMHMHKKAAFSAGAPLPKLSKVCHIKMSNTALH